MFAFVFFGFTQKQVVELKLPNKNKIQNKNKLLNDKETFQNLGQTYFFKKIYIKIGILIINTQYSRNA